MLLQNREKRKGKSCRLRLNSCDCPVTNLHFSVSVSTRDVSKSRMGWANTKMGSVHPHRKEAPVDPSPGSLCWECREVKPSGNIFHSLQVQPCFTVRKSYQPLIDWPLPTQIIMWDVSTSGEHLGEMGGIGSKKHCFSESQTTRIFILQKKVTFSLLLQSKREGKVHSKEKHISFC